MDDIELRQILQNKFDEMDLRAKKFIIVIPDDSRSGPAGKFFKIICEVLNDKVEALDFLIAIGTHPVMSKERIFDYLNITEQAYNNKYSKNNIFNHRWNKD